MRRLLSCLPALIILAGCGHSSDSREPTTRPEVAPLLELAKSPEVELDAIDAPAAPRGFNRADVLILARALIDAAERTDTAGTDAAMSERDAVDHTFAGLDMRSRRDMTTYVESASEQYKSMPIAWTLADQWESGHRPVGPGRIIKAAWRVRSAQGHLGVSLQFIRSYLDARGNPMFVDRRFTLWNSNPQRTPGTQTYLGFAAGITGIDRCHLVETGLIRPDRDAKNLQRAAKDLREDVASDEVRESSDTDFRRGCD